MNLFIVTLNAPHPLPLFGFLAGMQLREVFNIYYDDGRSPIYLSAIDRTPVAPIRCNTGFPTDHGSAEHYPNFDFSRIAQQRHSGGIPLCHEVRNIVVPYAIWSHRKGIRIPFLF